MKLLLSVLLVFLFLSSQLFSSDWRVIDTLGPGSTDNAILVSCADSNNCFALAQYPWFARLYKSTDQGLTWNKIHQTDPFNEEFPFDVNTHIGISPTPNYYFISMYQCPRILKSTDGGISFKRIELDTCVYDWGLSISDFAMYDTNYGFASSDTYYYTTKDGWETFNEYEKKGNQKWAFFSPVFLDSNTVVMTYAGKHNINGFAFLKYHLNENKWDTLSFFPREKDSIYMPRIYKIFFVNDTLGFGCGYQYINLDSVGYSSWDIIYRTTDGGYHWKRVLKQSPYVPMGLQDIAFYDTKNGVAVGQYGKIWLTNDGGDTWVLSKQPLAEGESFPGHGDPVMNITWAGQHPIAGTWNTGIIRYEGDYFDFTPDTTQDTTSVDIYAKRVLGKIDINVKQVRTQLYISISDEQYRYYKLEIVDIMGNIVKRKTLHSGIGTLYIPYDLTDMTNGTYLYMISTQGIVAKTGKISIIK